MVMNAMKRPVVVACLRCWSRLRHTPRRGAAARRTRWCYHFSDGVEQASNGLRNINNHLEVNPTAKIIVVRTRAASIS